MDLENITMDSHVKTMTGTEQEKNKSSVKEFI